MPIRCRALLLAVVLLPPLAQPALAAGWELAEESTLGFTALQQGSPVEGRFERFSAAIELDPEALAGSSIEVAIDVASVASGHKDRDAALRSSSFFEVARWPEARFASREVVHLEGERYEAQGELTIRDVTRAVVLPFTLTIGPDPADGGRLVARASGDLAIARLDYGVGQGEFASTKTVGDEVVIHVAIVATKPR
jgi:polyisoprenoid-binding protein YceI